MLIKILKIGIGVGLCLTTLAVTNAQDGLYDNGNSTVSDFRTGLMWHQNAYTALLPTWNGANTHCVNSALAEHNDWRLPTVKELNSITDRTTVSPAIDRRMFPGTANARFWTATDIATDPTRAWVVNLAPAEIIAADKGDGAGQFRARCVRQEN